MKSSELNTVKNLNMLCHSHPPFLALGFSASVGVQKKKESSRDAPNFTLSSR
jgi:hypothetical protein